MHEASRESETIKVFYSYAREDEAWRDKLVAHLTTLQRMGFIVQWHDRKIPPGVEFDPAIKQQLESSRIILLLVSADFIGSEYIYHHEMKRALERHRDGESRTIPVILRPCDWQPYGVPNGERRLPRLGELNALPKDGEPVTSRKWDSEDAALYNVTEGIKATVHELIPKIFSDDEPIEPPPSAPPGTDQVIYQAAIGTPPGTHPRPSLLRAMLAHLRAFSRDVHLTLLDKKFGSLYLVLRGSRAGFERLQLMYQEGTLTHLFGFEIQEVEHLDDVEEGGRGESGAPGAATTDAGGGRRDAGFDVEQIRDEARAAEERGDFEGALRAYHRGVRAARASGDKSTLAALTNDVGVVFKKARMFDLARQFFNAALDMFAQLRDHHAVKIIRGNLDELDSLERQLKVAEERGTSRGDFREASPGWEDARAGAGTADARATAGEMEDEDRASGLSLGEM